MKKRANVTFSENGAVLLDLLVEKLGVSRSGILELAIRRLAISENIEPPPVAPQEQKTATKRPKAGGSARPSAGQ